MITTTVSGDAFFISLKKSIPSTLGNRKSVITASKFVDCNVLMPSRALEKEVTAYPSLVNLSSSDTRISFSSSTMSILFFILNYSFKSPLKKWDFVVSSVERFRGLCFSVVIPHFHEDKFTTPFAPFSKGDFYAVQQGRQIQKVVPCPTLPSSEISPL